jgi:hypothetical protein
VTAIVWHVCLSIRVQSKEFGTSTAILAGSDARPRSLVLQFDQRDSKLKDIGWLAGSACNTRQLRALRKLLSTPHGVGRLAVFGRYAVDQAVMLTIQCTANLSVNRPKVSPQNC